MINNESILSPGKKSENGFYLICIDKELIDQARKNNEFEREKMNEKLKKMGVKMNEENFDFTKIKDFSQKSSRTGGLPKIPMFLMNDQVQFICKMVGSELQELIRAKTIGEQADALVDAIYYMIDAAYKSGVDLNPIFEIVHNANMAKLADKDKITRGELGKIEKPEGWEDPKELIEEAIKSQCKTLINIAPKGSPKHVIDMQIEYDYGEEEKEE